MDPSLLALVLLGLAIAGVWLPPVRIGGGPGLPPWTVLFVAATLVALAVGMVDARGLAALGGLGTATWLSRRASTPTRRRAATVALVGLAFLLGTGLLPGFGGWVGEQGIRLAPDAATMGLSLRFAPGVAGLLLLAVCCRRVRSRDELRPLVRPTLLVAAITVPAVMAVGVAAGYVRWDPKLPGFTAAFVAKTLLFTAVMEEAFFRGVVQERVDRRLRAAIGHGRCRLPAAVRRIVTMVVPVAVSTLPFGLAHARAGWLFVGLATLAGLGYALAYALTRRIEAPIVVHAGVNTVHFMFFTYPHLLSPPS